MYEIATMTRAAPRKLYGFKDRGELGPGAVADIAVYKPQRDKAATFRNAAYVFKDGQLVVRDGEAQRFTRLRFPSGAQTMFALADDLRIVAERFAPASRELAFSHAAISSILTAAPSAPRP